jgi:hypothetical protein
MIEFVNVTVSSIRPYLPRLVRYVFFVSLQDKYCFRYLIIFACHFMQTLSPTLSPTFQPTFSPTVSPTISPIDGPGSPTRRPAKGPDRNKCTPKRRQKCCDNPSSNSPNLTSKCKKWNCKCWQKWSIWLWWKNEPSDSYLAILFWYTVLIFNKNAHTILRCLINTRI